MSAPEITVFAAFAAILAALLIGGTLLAAPIRRKMVVVANDIYGDRASNEALKNRIDFLLDTSASPLIAVLLIIASIATMIDGIFFSDNDEREYGFEKDPRYLELVGLYFGSVMLANPIAAALFLPITLFCFLVHRSAKGIRGIRLADAQIDRVAHSRLART